MPYSTATGWRPNFTLTYEHDQIVCTVESGSRIRKVKLTLGSIDASAAQIEPLIRAYGAPGAAYKAERIGLRVVAPSGYFLQDYLLDEDTVARLKALRLRAPLHIDATLHEYALLQGLFPNVPVAGISDSAFHSTKPDYAWNYGLPLADSDRLELKRFGYHGLSLASAVRVLRGIGKLPPKVVICHLGSGASVSAVWHGKSYDTTMGYSPLEGLIMATRSGSIDVTLAAVLKTELELSDIQLDAYLNEHSGLLGLSGISSDIRELLERESNGDHFARLALETYVYTVQKAIGQMTASLGGVDMLVFTGTVGERSAQIRKRVMHSFRYLDFALDQRENGQCIDPAEPVCISQLAHSRPIYVIPANEAGEIARRTAEL